MNDVHSEDAVVIGGAGQGQHLLNRDGHRIAVLDQVQSGFHLEVINCDDDAGLEGGAHFGEQGFAATRRRDVTQNLKDVSFEFFWQSFRGCKYFPKFFGKLETSQLEANFKLFGKEPPVGLGKGMLALILG